MSAGLLLLPKEGGYASGSRKPDANSGVLLNGSFVKPPYRRTLYVLFTFRVKQVVIQ